MYGLRYIREYTNLHDETCKVEFWKKDYTGASEHVLGSGDSFVLSKEQDNLYEPIQAQPATIELLTDEQTKFGIDQFYSEDDEMWLVKFYYKDALYYTGFILQDESEDEFISYQHFIHLTATDNLGLLSNISFDVACGDIDPYQHFTIADYLQICLAKTGLQLPIQIFANIYELNQTKRSDDATATFVDQTRLYSGRFASEDGKWDSCFDVLSDVLESFSCILCQRQGAWVVYRWTELRALDNATFAGTQYSYDLSVKTAVTLENKPVVITEKRNPLVGGESNVTTIERPYKYVELTYNYDQPAQLLKDEDLQDLGAHISTSNSTDGLYRYEDYQFPAYFRHETGSGIVADTSFIRVITEIATNTETEREVITPCTGNDYKWLVWKPIEVSAGDVLDFTEQFKALSSSSNPLQVHIRFQLFYVDGSGNTVIFDLSPFHGTDTTYGKYTWVYNGNIGAQLYKQAIGVPYTVADNITEWNTFSLSGTLAQDWIMPAFPFSGILVVSFAGANTTSSGGSFALRDVATKDISLSIKNRINESFDIVGQTHTQNQAGTIKNNKEDTIRIDDSPRLSIAGALLLDELTHFDYFNYDGYMSLTKLWQRNLFEQARLGQITSAEEKQVFNQLRYKLDCTFIFTDYIDNLTTFRVNYLGASNFRLGLVSSINFYTCQCKAVLVEVWKSGEDYTAIDYKFEFKYEKS